MSKGIEIVNWDKFQTYKDRMPKWIKLNIDLTEKHDAKGFPKKFYKLPDSAKLTFLMLLCKRAYFTEVVPYESDKELAKLLGLSRINTQPLIAADFIRTIQNNTEVYESCTPDRETETERETEREGIFSQFQKSYPGKKRGLDTEYKNLQKKHSDWKDVVYILYTSLEQQKTQRSKDKANNKFIPEWPHLSTYINQRRWEMVDGSVDTPEQKAEKEKSKAEAKYQEYKAEQSQWLLELTVEQIKNYPTKSTNFLRLVKELRPEVLEC